jgi:O-antigen ligase
MYSKNRLPVLEEKQSLWLVLTTVFLFASLFWAGNAPLPLMVLELAALILLGLWWAYPKRRSEVSPLETALVGGIVFLPLLQFIPLPPTLWGEVLPGRAFYADALREALGESFFAAELRAVAIIPRYSEAAWLALLPPIAVFLATRSLSFQYLQRLAYLFLGIAVFQAVLGLLQYGAGPGSFFCLGNRYCGDRAVGTYIGRAHLAGLLEMALPITVALLVSTVGKFSQLPHRHHQEWRRRFFSWGVWQGNRTMLYTAMAVVILLGIVFTRSRAGILLAMTCLLLSFFIFAPRVGAKKAYGTVGILIFAGAILALEIGLAPIVERFTLRDPLEEGRWTIFAGSLQAAGEFFPLGSGGGSFAEVFQRFQPADFMGGFVHRAHNDYLEWLVVGGLPAAILIAAALFLYAWQWVRVWQGQGKYASTFSFIQMGAGLGLFLLLLHTGVDFNLHIPANAIFFAFLAGIFFCPPERRRRNRDQAHPLEAVTDLPPQPRTIPPENQINPFAD